MAAADRLRAAEFGAGVRVIAGRELAAYFDSNIAYVYAIAFTLIANSQFMNEFFLAGTVEMGGFFHLLPLLLAFLVPAITMRLWAEERKARTVEVLLTLPIVPWQAVLGKYVAALGLFGFVLAGTLPIPGMLLALGRPDLGVIASGYFGVVLFGALFLALGMFLSALSSDQITAFVLSALAGLVLVLSGHERVVPVLDGLAPGLRLGSWLSENFSALPPYEAFTRGVIGVEGLAYFGLLSGLFLWLTARLLERQRS